jgi:timeless
MATRTVTVPVGTAAQQPRAASAAAAPQRVTPPTKSKKTSASYASDPALSVDKKVVDELLLVCGVIASRDEATGKIVPVTDCLNWLQDLQRALRRDDDSYRSISLLLSGWKVVQQKLLPLVLECRYDTPLVLTIVKILVILTKPISEQAKRAGRLVIDVASKKIPEE